MAAPPPTSAALPAFAVRPAVSGDAVAALALRAHAWQQRYGFPEGNVSRELLERVAPLPPAEAALRVYRERLQRPADAPGLLVATLEEGVIGCVLHHVIDDGTGDIGVFVADAWDGRGVGDALLVELLRRTTHPLRVEIFARNPSRAFYERHGFVAAGAERRHHFGAATFLPTLELRLERG